MSAAITTAPLKRPTRTPKVERHLEVVETPRPRHTLLYALITVVVIAAAVFGAVSLNALAAGVAVEGRELEARVAVAERSYAQLVADVAVLEDPARIRDEALELGLVPAGPGRHVILDRNLPADGAMSPLERAGATADPLKPMLSVDR